VIVGAGLAGLIAAHIFPDDVIEASPAPQATHKALLRFRNQEVSRVTGIDFTPVKVRKGVWSFDKNEFVAPSIRLANQYSSKCLNGWLANDRSIWNLEPCIRYIAPEDFYEQLLSNLADRVHWESPMDFAAKPQGLPLISTVPMDVVLGQLGIPTPDVTFNKESISVMRFRVRGCELYQTVYYPEPDFPIYRASITKDLLIIERAESDDDPGVGAVCRSFGVSESDIELLESTSQRYGKIASIDDFTRKMLIGKLTSEHGIFSLGRFATWKNILLDDVVNDAMVIKKLLKATDYERKLHQHK